jgi:hypothetical protein
VKALHRRLVLLEERRSTVRPAVRLFWDDSVVPCLQHVGCAIEQETGRHLSGLLRLSFMGAAE